MKLNKKNMNIAPGLRSSSRPLLSFSKTKKNSEINHTELRAKTKHSATCANVVYIIIYLFN